MKTCIILIGFLIPASVFLGNQIYAYSIEYETYDPQFFGIPNVCSLEPDYVNDYYLTKNDVKKMMTQGRYSISEWEVQLQQGESRQDKEKWKINYVEVPLDKQKNYNYKNCDVTITFSRFPKNETNWYSQLGVNEFKQDENGNHSVIFIYYGKINICKSKDEKFIYYDPCYGTGTRTSDQLGNVIRHEFGHALGLGHYKSDDEAINEAWAKGNSPSPSLMTVMLHENTQQQKIKPLDIEKVKSMYGESGFLRVSTMIPDWVRNSAEWWAERQIADSDFVSGIQHLIKQNIIHIQDLPGSNEATIEIIPDWIRNNAKWWAQGLISDDDFLKGIQYLIENGIIKV